MSRKRDELDKNLLRLLTMFLIITMDTLVIDTKPVLTKETFRAMWETSIRVEFNVISSLRMSLFQVRDKILIDLDLIS